MPLNSNHYYNPFTKSFLGAAMKDPISTSNATIMIFEEVDLYYQPVPNPFVAGPFSIIMVLILIIGWYLHLEVYLMVKKEDSILKNVSKAYVFAQMIFGPTAIISICFTNFVHNLPPATSKVICPVAWFLFYFCWNMISFHSFVSATMRYFFIVHTNKVKLYGKQNVKNAFFIASILIPMLITIWKAIDGSELDFMSFFNKCYGKHHKLFLVEISTAKVFKKNFCHVTNFIELEGFEKVTALGKQVFCIASTTTILIMGSNISEFFIYYKLFRYMDR